jgi:hypothetical protein
VPVLPPKEFGIFFRNEDSQSMHVRKKGIKNFIQSLINHPVFGQDEMLHVFLTEKADFQFEKYHS